MNLTSLSRRAAVAMLLVMLVVVPTALQFTDVEDADAAPGDHLWSKRFGDAAAQMGYSAAAAGSGNSFVTGEFAGSADFGGGPLTSAGSSDIFLAKFDAAGNHLWSKRFGDANYQVGLSVAVDGSGNAFLTGAFLGSVDFGGGPLTSAGGYDIFLAKFDAAGNHLWSKRFGGADTQSGSSVAVDGSGNAFLTGYFYGSVDFGGGPLTSAGRYDIFLAKFDAGGNHLWSKRFGGANDQYGYGIAVDGSGNAFLSGSFAGSVDFGGGPLTSAGLDDIFLATFDAAGNHVWSKRFGGANNQSGSSVAVDGSGNAFLTGYFAGSVDFGGGPLTSAGGNDIFLAKFAAAAAVGGIAERPDVASLPPAASIASRKHQAAYELAGLVGVLAAAAAGAGAITRRRRVR